MAFQFTDIATSDYMVVFNRLIDFAVTNGWTETIPREDWSYSHDSHTSTEKRCQLEGPGFDATHRIHLQFRTMHHAVADKWEIQCRLVYGYNAQEGFNTQNFSNGYYYWAHLPLGNEPMRTWISVTDTRVIIVVRIGGTTQILCGQFRLTGLPPADYAYPALVFGSHLTSAQYYDALGTSKGYRYDSATLSQGLYLYGGLNYVNEVNVNIIGSTQAISMIVTGDGFADKAPLPDGTRGLYPIVVCNMDSDVGYAGIQFVIDGVYRVNGDGLSVEDTITAIVGGPAVVHTVFNNIARASNDDYFVLENL